MVPIGGPKECASLANEMLQLRDMLDRAGEQLSIDPAIAGSHAMALQLIDGVAQRLGMIGIEPGTPIAATAASFQ